MKKITTTTVNIILLLVTLSIFSCKKQQSKNALTDLDNLNLSETIWEGKLLLRNTESAQPIDIRISFTDQDKGGYYVDEKFKPIFSGHSLNTSLSYEKKHKTIFFEGGYNNVLLGNWWLQKREENSLVFFRQNGTKADSLSIKKTN